MNVSHPRTISAPFRRTLPVLCAVLAASACTGPEPFREGVRISDRLFPGAETSADRVFLTRLVDDLSGAPIVGAEVFLVDESKTPIAGEFWYSARGASDAEGFVRIGLPPGARSAGWQVVRHPSCGVATRTDPEAIWRLGRGFDLPVRILDWLGRPAAFARIGFCGGCGHTPDLVNATADENGLAVLRGIDPKNDIADLYVQHPGLHYFYESVDWLPGAPPMVVQCRYAPAMSGKVVDHRGAPVAGAFVCGGAQHRGPWARTAADGSFVVLGAEPPTYPHHVVTPAGRDVYFDTSTAWPVTLRLPDPAEQEHEGVVVGQPPAAQPVAVREVRVEVVGAPGGVEFGTFIPERYDGALAAHGRVLVPERGSFVLDVWPAGAKRAGAQSFPFTDGALVQEPLVVQWTPDVRVVGRIVDPSGRPRSARVGLGYRSSGVPRRGGSEWIDCPEGAVQLALPSGRWLLEVEDREGTLRSRFLWLTVPESGPAASVDLGLVPLPAAGQLRFVTADGAPLRGALAAFARPGWQTAGEAREWRLDDNGAFSGPDLLAGDAVAVQLDDSSTPCRTVLSGSGPWTIQVPAGQLSVQIVDANGNGLDGAIVFADQFCAAPGGAANLRGLPHGPMRLFVSAPGHRSAIVDAIVTDVPQTVRVELPRR